jgi:hypothetical protein
MISLYYCRKRRRKLLSQSVLECGTLFAAAGFSHTFQY